MHVFIYNVISHTYSNVPLHTYTYIHVSIYICLYICWSSSNSTRDKCLWAAQHTQRRCLSIPQCRFFLSLRFRSFQVPDCSSANSERELALDRRETSSFYPTHAFDIATVTEVSTRGICWWATVSIRKHWHYSHVFVHIHSYNVMYSYTHIHCFVYTCMSIRIYTYACIDIRI